MEKGDPDFRFPNHGSTSCPLIHVKVDWELWWTRELKKTAAKLMNLYADILLIMHGKKYGN